MEDLLVQFLVEVVAQLLVELGIELSFRKYYDKQGAEGSVRSFFAFIGYLGLAIFIGGLSLNWFPNHFIQNKTLRLINLFFSPLLAGTVFHFLGNWLKARHKRIIGMDNFITAFCFALAMNLMRYFFAK